MDIQDLKFKYSKSEIFAVLDLYERTVCLEQSRDINDRLLVAILLNVYKRIRKMTIEIKEQYTLKYKPEEALAFALYFNNAIAYNVYEKRLIYLTIAETDRKLL